MSKTSTFLKRLGGVSMAVAGILGTVNTAQAAVANNGLGDLAIVPYYTVQNNYVTGMHITNVTASTQVVKIRLRRDSDSADVLDFNVVMSPQDVFTGWVDDSAGTLGFYTTDNSCTVPATTAGFLAAPAVNSTGAEEGYIEVIGMAQTLNETQQIAVDALHSNGTPANCDRVRENFFANGTAAIAANAAARVRGVADNNTTIDGDRNQSEYVDTNNQAFKVSYFIRDTNTGMEFGDNALHIQGFGSAYETGYGETNAIHTEPSTIIASDSTVTVPAAGNNGTGAAMMTNQQTGLFAGDTTGFDFPDLDGGGSNIGTIADTVTLLQGPSGGNIVTLRGRYDDVIRNDIGATAVINDWSYNTANGVATDWVVTFPGQYLMVDPAGNRPDVDDLPATANITVYDREESQTGGLVVSPQAGTAATLFSNEVNVVEWGGQSVFGSQNVVSITNSSSDEVFGWAMLAVTSDAGTEATIFDLTDTAPGAAGTRCITDVTPPVTGDDRCTKGATAGAANMDFNAVPMVGFTAWQRTFTDASKNYGRIIPHSFN